MTLKPALFHLPAPLASHLLSCSSPLLPPPSATGALLLLNTPGTFPLQGLYMGCPLYSEGFLPDICLCLSLISKFLLVCHLISEAYSDCLFLNLQPPALNCRSPLTFSAFFHNTYHPKRDILYVLVYLLSVPIHQNVVSAITECTTICLQMLKWKKTQLFTCVGKIQFFPTTCVFPASLLLTHNTSGY